MTLYTGWLLDLYADPQDGVVLWLLDDDGARRCLRQDFSITFYAAGPTSRLRHLWRFIEGVSKNTGLPVQLERTQRHDLFEDEPRTVLAVHLSRPAAQTRLFHEISREFPELTYYDADLPLALHYAAAYSVFPLARCRLEADDDDRVRAITAIDSPWDLDPSSAPLQILYLEPDTNPSHTPPTCLSIRYERLGECAGRSSYRLPLAPERPFLINLRAILRRHDPDLLLTDWGDTWLLPHLLSISKRWRIPLSLNRDRGRGVARRPERTYFSYGRVIHRGQQIHLFGRWHIDRYNAVLFHDYGLEGVLELGRVTALPLQTAARVSPGSGISAMQILTALRQDILVPWHKQQAERLKTVPQMLRADQGGMVYQPLMGLHRDVGTIDFISMYPSIMAHFNLSPETVGKSGAQARLIPQLGIPVDLSQAGLVPQTLKPLLEKRLAFKSCLGLLPNWDPRRKIYKARASAQKWLLVTCFGYLGYKNARFGRIEAHEAVTAYGREALLRAKEAAEDMGYTVIHMYVDGLWVKKPGASQPLDFQPLLDEVVARTGLPIALDGVHRWIAFLPSRQNERIPVANRYFGVFQDGSLKLRGIEARRRDTPPFIETTQVELIEQLARIPNLDQLPEHLPKVLAWLRRKFRKLRLGQIPVEGLLVNQQLSRNLDDYRSPSPAARAAAQLESAGKTVKRGQPVLLVYTRGGPGVTAWDLPAPVASARVDLARYMELFLRAMSTVLQPFGIDQPLLTTLLMDNAADLPLPGLFSLPPGFHHPSPFYRTGAALSSLLACSCLSGNDGVLNSCLP